MKKFQSLKLMLLGLLVMGSGSAFAQAPAETSEITVGSYVYTVTKESKVKNGATTTGTVQITRLAEGGTTVKNGNELNFDGHIVYPVGSYTYQYDVTTMSPTVFQDNSYYVQKAVIPKELTEIPTGAFNTLTNLYDLTFEEGSQVVRIGAQAFASTQISKFDFRPCTKLEGLNDGVFVQDGPVNQETGYKEEVNNNIKTIVLPESTAFKHINGAFRNLPKLGAASENERDNVDGKTGLVNLDKSWIRELIDGAFYGCTSLTTLSLPGNDLQYISSKALEGSAIEDLTVNVNSGVTNGNPLKLLGGCTITYRENNGVYTYNYEDNEFAPADANWNLYGLDVEDYEAGDVAPLRKLTIKGGESQDPKFTYAPLMGKICTNAFAWCTMIADEEAADDVVEEPAFDVSMLEFGTQAQIETHAFYNCENITELTLNDIKYNQLANNGWTIEDNAFEGCPIATLTLGDVMTANAIGSAAFGNSLVTVTIGTVKAGDSAFKAAAEGQEGQAGTDPVLYTYTEYLEANGLTSDELSEEQFEALDDNEKIKTPGTPDTPGTPATPGAFVWADKTNAKLFLATGAGEYVSSDNPDAAGKIIPEGTFDFSAVVNGREIEGFVYPEVTIGDIMSMGGVFAEGAIIGENVNKMTFGKILTKGLDVSILQVTEGEPITTPGTETSWTLVGGNENPTSYTYAEATEGTILEGNPTSEADIDKFILATEGDTEEENTYNKIESVTPGTEGSTEPVYTNRLSELTFNGAILTNGIGAGAFINFVNLAKVTFVDLMSKEAVATGSFTGSGLVGEDGNIGTKEKPFINYTANLTGNDASENPFATDAFADAEVNRIIYWAVTDETLYNNILAGIQQAVLGEDYEGEAVNPKFNIYKWVAYIQETPGAAKGFIVFTDNTEIVLDKNIDETTAWGRYDLGSFKEEKGTKHITVIDPETQQKIRIPDTEFAGYEQTDMIIPRFQTVYGVTDVERKTPYDVKVTLYGVYWDQDDNAEQSDIYMVPLQVINGEYHIQGTNTHLIIAKVKNLGTTDNTTFAEDQILIGYTVPEADDDDDDDDDQNDDNPDEPAEFVSAFAANDNSVWVQLQNETSGNGPVLDADAEDGSSIKRVFEKADLSWTNQELVDGVKKNQAGETIATLDHDGKDLYAMLNPAANAGFDFKKFIIERKTDGTGAFIGLGWYYTLLKHYDPSRAARIIWLDDAQATAIFGVKDGKAAVNSVKNGAIYNMLGQKVSKTYRGVIIQNGKKSINK